MDLVEIIFGFKWNENYTDCIIHFDLRSIDTYKIKKKKKLRNSNSADCKYQRKILGHDHFHIRLTNDSGNRGNYRVGKWGFLSDVVE